MTRRLLIVDDLASNRSLLKARLSTSYHEIHLASSGEEAREMTRRLDYDLILLDYDMPGMNGVELCAHLRASKHTARSALLMVTSHPNPRVRLQALAAGADDVLARESAPMLLQARVRSLLAATERERALREVSHDLDRLSLAEGEAGFEHRPLIGLIATSPEDGQRWQQLLQPWLSARFMPLCREEALRTPVPAPDVYLIAEPSDHGIQAPVLLAELRASSGAAKFGACLVVPPETPELMVAALDMGADDVVPLGTPPEELALRLRRLITRKRQLEAMRRRLTAGLRLAVTDPLTGLSNRRLALPELALLHAKGPTARSFAVMVLDIDHFKGVNDRYGHPAGDAVLQAVAMRLRVGAPRAEIIARLGGDEFLVAHSIHHDSDAALLAERLRCAIAEHPVAISGIPGGMAVTASIGVAIAMPSDEDSQGLLARADQALLAAKARGRDQIRLRGPTAA